MAATTVVSGAAGARSEPRRVLAIRIAIAAAVVALWEAASASGVAAIDFEGQMVDEPLAARARQVLAAAEGGGEHAP